MTPFLNHPEFEGIEQPPIGKDGFLAYEDMALQAACDAEGDYPEWDNDSIDDEEDC
jgi:hypothetical protein